MAKSRLKKTEATSVTASDTVKTPKPKSSKKPAPLAYPEEASKQDRMIVLLKRNDGATIDELIGATNWQKHSVRGFLSATVRKKMALPLVSEFRPTGERVYRIADAVHA